MSKSLNASQLQSRAQKLQAQWVGLHSARPRILYHYTDAAGLLGLLKTNRLWATNRRFMNDPTETEYAANLIRAALNDSRTAEYVATKERDKKRRQSVLDAINGGIDYLLTAYVDQDEHYLACFCEEGDLLSQWRGYGSIGGGYAVGFSAKHLGLVQHQTPEKPEPVLRRVIYDPKRQRHVTRLWLNFIIDWQRFCEQDKPAALKGSIDYYDFGWNYLNWFVSQSLRCFKHPAYKEEQEWRVIQVGTGYGGTRAVDPNFRAARRGIVEYVELELPLQKEKLPVKLICYGPTLDPKVTDRSLSLLCRGKGYGNVKIKKSIVPFAG